MFDGKSKKLSFSFKIKRALKSFVLSFNSKNFSYIIILTYDKEIFIFSHFNFEHNKKYGFLGLLISSIS